MEDRATSEDLRKEKKFGLGIKFLTRRNFSLLPTPTPPSTTAIYSTYRLPLSTVIALLVPHSILLSLVDG